MGYRIGIDVGGTFTDLALYHDQGETLRLSKILTTPDDPSVAVLDGLDTLLRDAALRADELTEASHATTIATNTVIQRKGPATALLTTEGFRDILIIGRQKRWELYDNAIDKPSPVVRRRAIWEVPERLLHDGSVRTPLDEAAVRRAARAMVADDIRAVAVCFLHSYVNPAHERRAGEIIAEAAPDLVVTLSSDVSPIYREYERASTTTLNAYVIPPVAAYIARLEQGLRARGYRRELYIMQSNGGLATPEIAKKYPVRILESGPAAGVLTAAKFVEAAGTGNLLSFDMGGTTAKVCLIEDGKPVVTGQFEFDMVNLKKNSGLPISIPAIELVEVGSGGGSLARTEMGAIVVGPESAGSKPGPMCYGLGGTRPTVTDADLVLGYLNPDYFLGGQMKLDLDAAKRGIELEIAGPLGLGVEAAAWGIHEVVTAQMAQAARVVSVGRGKDPREFVLVAFGGAGPVHGVRLASMLGVRRAVFPVGAGVASAIGLLMADPAFDLVRTSLFPLEAGALVQVNAVFADLEAQAKEQLRAGALSGAVRTERSCDMRFAGQGYEINVPLPAGPYAAEDLPHLHEVFFAAYAATYGDRAFNRDDPVVGVHWRLRAVVERPPFHFAKAHQGDGKGTAAFKGTRPVYFPETDGFVDCPIFERSRLGAGDRVAGPAVIEERESTIVLIPASEARVDQQGNVVVTISN
jgi:N-methylhydantoinase A